MQTQHQGGKRQNNDRPEMPERLPDPLCQQPCAGQHQGPAQTFHQGLWGLNHAIIPRLCAG